MNDLKPAGQFPQKYELEPGSGIYFMIGSEVGQHMGLFRGLLYKKYPGLWSMLCSPEQRRYLIQIAAPKQRLELMNISNVTIPRGRMKGDYLSFLFLNMFLNIFLKKLIGECG